MTVAKKGVRELKTYVALRSFILHSFPKFY